MTVSAFLGYLHQNAKDDLSQINNTAHLDLSLLSVENWSAAGEDQRRLRLWLRRIRRRSCRSDDASAAT